MKRACAYAAAVAVFGLLGAVVPAMASVPPAGQDKDNIAYVTGGIGDGSEQELKSQSSHYRLHVINQSRDGAFTGGAHISIRARNGRELLNVDGGPLLYANLPPGKYTVQAEAEGRTQSKPITIASNRSKNLRFFW